MFLVRFLVIVLFIVIVQAVENSDIIVRTSEGLIRGLPAETRKNRKVFAFYGVRYAEPPTGVYRFRAPIPTKPWKGVFNATQQGQACMQDNPLSTYSISEDCLFLDVYTPSLRGLKPVIAYIHGGQFLFGAKSDISHEYLLDKDVVLVSVNYRLGVFGFLATGTNHIAGNWGFKDQNLALKWIQRNIKVFGGNPRLVTLSGHSAGSFSVTLHLVSPVSQGLFQRAIAMSGSVISQSNSTTLESSQIFLGKSQCNYTDAKKSLQCLQNLSDTSILEIGRSIDTSVLSWIYVIENRNFLNSFLTEHPVSIARRGRLSRVPLIAGVDHDEFINMAYDIYNNQPDTIDILNTNFNQVAPFMFLYKNSSEKDFISCRLREFYLNNESITANNLDKLGELFSDSIIRYGVHRLMEIARRKDQVFYYRFDYQGRYSHAYKPNGEPLGVVHGDELQYIFVFKKIAPIIGVNDTENKIIEQMTSWWSQFAKTGNPNDKTNEWTNDVDWKSTDRQYINSFYINKTCISLPIEYNWERYKLWDELFA